MKHPRRPGRIRYRLSVLLTQLGFIVDAANIVKNDVFSRTADGIAWEVYSTRFADGRSFRLFSWDTMSECVRKGICLCKPSDSDYEVSVIEGEGSNETS